LVLKLWREPDHEPRLEREAAALQALGSAGLPAPQVREVVTVVGRPGLVVDRVPGVSLLDKVGAKPLLFERVARAMAEAHAAMHAVVAPAELPSLKDDLRDRIEAAEPLPPELCPPVLAVLDALPDGDRLCHGDLHPGNMLGTASEPMLIDWGDASRGDPLGDVVRTAVLIRVGEPPPHSPRLIRLLARGGGGLLSARYVAHHRKQRDIDMADFARWRAVRAAARLAEPIPEEHPRLLKILRRDLESGIVPRRQVPRIGFPIRGERTFTSCQGGALVTAARRLRMAWSALSRI
jgi:aminoglycoside phosphotransferase (APT) family kinase protein